MGLESLWEKQPHGVVGVVFGVPQRHKEHLRLLPFPLSLEVLFVLLVEQFLCAIMSVPEAQTDTVFVSNPSSGMFEIAEASGVRAGTKIIIHLKKDCKEFANEDRVKGE